MQRPTTHIGSVARDLLSLPWNKVLSALIVSLIIYILAARLTDLHNELHRVELKFTNETHELRREILSERASSLATHREALFRLELEMNRLEMNRLEMNRGCAPSVVRPALTSE